MYDCLTDDFLSTLHIAFINCCAFLTVIYYKNLVYMFLITLA